MSAQSLSASLRHFTGQGVPAIALGVTGPALNVVWLRAQGQAAAGPQFDAASIKPSTSGWRGVMRGACQGTDRDISAGGGALEAMAGAAFNVAPIPAGSCRVTNASLKMLIRIA